MNEVVFFKEIHRKISCGRGEVMMRDQTVVDWTKDNDVKIENFLKYIYLSSSSELRTYVIRKHWSKKMYRTTKTLSRYDNVYSH